MTLWKCARTESAYADIHDKELPIGLGDVAAVCMFCKTGDSLLKSGKMHLLNVWLNGRLTQPQFFYQLYHLS